jgi:hypothetical protein
MFLTVSLCLSAVPSATLAKKDICKGQEMRPERPLCFLVKTKLFLERGPTTGTGQWFATNKYIVTVYS